MFVWSISLCNKDQGPASLDAQQFSSNEVSANDSCCYKSLPLPITSCLKKRPLRYQLLLLLLC